MTDDDEAQALDRVSTGHAPGSLDDLLARAGAAVPPAPASRYACPCCGHLTLTRAPPGTFELCQVCFWEDDPVQFEDPAYRGGANTVSLTEARANVARYGAVDEAARTSVRPTRSEERS